MHTAVQGFQQRLITLQATAPVRVDAVGDAHHLVVPVVMLVEGVTNEQFISAKELGNSAPSWNGRPVVINHPKIGSWPVSALDPRVLAQVQVGTIFNARLEGNKLKADLWIDQEKVKTMSREAQDLIKRLEMGLPVEVSTGYFVRAEMRKGTFQGKHFNEIDHDIIPDHLALLTEEQGACSWEDGCGAPRLNENNNTKIKQKETIMNYEEIGAAPPVINSPTEAEEYVRRWYEKYEKLKIQSKSTEEFSFMPPPPPCIMADEK